ncbi:MAG TPA: glycine zipper 2TM domain-containing protein [Xanthomonadaceae bacterium]|jgi:uncharacterized protein YcfJ
MKTASVLAPLVLAMSIALPVGDAAAQPYPPPPPQQQYAQRVPRPVSFGYANVLRVTPVYDNYHAMEQQCDGPPQPAPRDTTGGTIIGAIIGGALGHTVGKGDGRAAATVGGAVIGGAIGHDVAKNSDPDYVPSGCRMVDVGGGNGQPAGFDVEYDYKGDVYVARMPYDPGNRIRVRVSVVPAEDGPPPPYGR